jgi:hypothetical protein
MVGDQGMETVKQHHQLHSSEHERRPYLPYCEPTIQVLAFWPRICDCTGPQPVI